MSPTASLAVYDWCFVTVCRHQSTSALSVAVEPNVVLMSVGVETAVLEADADADAGVWLGAELCCPEVVGATEQN